MTDVLPRSFYDRDAIDVARDLLGKTLVRELDGERLSARIVETEAYVGPHDLACHAAKGRTKRTEVMFGPAGRAYFASLRPPAAAHSSSMAVVTDFGRSMA